MCRGSLACLTVRASRARGAASGSLIQYCTVPWARAGLHRRTHTHAVHRTCLMRAPDAGSMGGPASREGASYHGVEAAAQLGPMPSRRAPLYPRPRRRTVARPAHVGCADRRKGGSPPWPRKKRADGRLSTRGRRHATLDCVRLSTGPVLLCLVDGEVVSL